MIKRNQCKAIAKSTKIRCRKSGNFGSDYCEYHGPLCQSTTNFGLPCNSMVLNFRDGYIYCHNHANVGIERFFGTHEPSNCNINEQPFKKKQSSINHETMNQKRTEFLNPNTTIKPTTIKSTTTTTTTITTTNEDHLSTIFSLLEFSNKKY